MNTKLYILLVDDDDDELDFFKDALSTLDVGTECLFAKGADGAMRFLKYLIPDIIFLDINMPRMNGIKCLEEIRKKMQAIPVVMYSTGLTKGMCDQAIAVGANRCITKPFRPSELSMELEPLLRNARADLRRMSVAQC